MRNPRASRTGRAKIDMAIAEEIRIKALKNPHIPYRMLGAYYGLTAQSVGKIVRRETWVGDDAFVPDDEPLPTRAEDAVPPTPEQAAAIATHFKRQIEEGRMPNITPEQIAMLEQTYGFKVEQSTEAEDPVLAKFNRLMGKNPEFKAKQVVAEFTSDKPEGETK